MIVRSRVDHPAVSRCSDHSIQAFQYESKAFVSCGWNEGLSNPRGDERVRKIRVGAERASAEIVGVVDGSRFPRVRIVPTRRRPLRSTIAVSGHRSSIKITSRARFEVVDL